MCAVLFKRILFECLENQNFVEKLTRVGSSFIDVCTGQAVNCEKIKRPSRAQDKFLVFILGLEILVRTDLQFEVRVVTMTIRRIWQEYTMVFKLYLSKQIIQATYISCPAQNLNLVCKNTAFSNAQMPEIFGTVQIIHIFS